ncbi:MAG: hypothetical protein ACRDO4_11955, partial [Nocardioides sp.]
MTGTPPLRTSRRRVLATPAAAVVAGLGVGGCDLAGSGKPSGTATSSTPTGTGTATPTPTADPDETLVARVRGEVAETAALVAAAGRGRRSLRRELAPFARLHRSHLEALPGDDADAARAQVSGDAATARRRVRQREEALRAGLADAAVVA